MDPLTWIPADYQSLTIFLLKIGLLSLAYTWVFIPIVDSINALWSGRLPMDIGTFLKVTLGHALIAILTILLLYAVEMPVHERILYGIAATLFFWITTIAELYEEYGSSPSARAIKSRIAFVLRFLLLIAWTCAIAFSLHTDVQRKILDVIHQRAWMTATIDSTIGMFSKVLALPFFIGFVLGALGVYALFRTLFKGLFATIGILGELRDFFRPRRDLPTVGRS